MLTYTFSTREKIMLAVLGVVALVVLWYQFIFVNIENQVSALDSQIATAQEQVIMYQTQAATLANMKAAVEEYEASGAQPVTLPKYDNTQNLMAYLNGVLGVTRSYSMSFDNPTLSDTDGTVHRTGTITFETNSYEEARMVVQNIARGPYPCQVMALGITDNTVQKAGSNSPVASNVQVTFFEEAPQGINLETDDGIGEGQDLSKLVEWDH